MVFCFSCGARLDGGLEQLGSLRCQDCRDAGVPLASRRSAPRTSLPRPVLTLIRSLPLPSEPPPQGAA